VRHLRRSEGPRLLRHGLTPAGAALLAAGLFLLPACRPAPTDPADLSSRVPLDRWLDEHPAIAASIAWEETDGSVRAYSGFTHAETRDLASLVESIRRGEETGLPEAPPLHTPRDPNGEGDGTDLDPEVAWRFFAAYVAQSLAAEIDRRVPWSMEALPAADRALLLDSRSLFVSHDGAYEIPYRLGFVTPGDPVRTRRFLEENDLLGATRRETIERLIDWSRDHLAHFVGRGDAASLLATWQYAGSPAVERMLRGTRWDGDVEPGNRHWTYGCWGTGGFLRAVLRTVNIPADVMARCDHALPHFPSEGVALSHGDDPYNRFTRSGRTPASRLLVDDATIERWLGDGSAASGCANVSRRVAEIALEDLPPYALEVYCGDLAKALPREKGRVFQSFASLGTVGDLEAAGLWRRLQERLDAIGGCAAFPRAGSGGG